MQKMTFLQKNSALNQFGHKLLRRQLIISGHRNRIVTSGMTKMQKRKMLTKHWFLRLICTNARLNSLKLEETHPIGQLVSVLQ